MQVAALVALEEKSKKARADCPRRLVKTVPPCCGPDTLQLHEFKDGFGSTDGGEGLSKSLFSRSDGWDHWRGCRRKSACMARSWQTAKMSGGGQSSARLLLWTGRLIRGVHSNCANISTRCGMGTRTRTSLRKKSCCCCAIINRRCSGSKSLACSSLPGPSQSFRNKLCGKSRLGRTSMLLRLCLWRHLSPNRGLLVQNCPP